MSWLKQTINSSVGAKSIVALTGLAMVGFVVGHLSGNLLVFGGPDAINGYAAWLRSKGALLWGARIGLIAVTGLHIYFTIRLNLLNKRARPIAYAKKSYTRASFASRTMVLSGLLSLSYILFHLAHFTFRVTSPEIAALGHTDVYQMLILSFSSPLVAVTYIAAMVLLGLHLNHGLSSLFQTLGLNHSKYNPIIRSIGPVLGSLLAAGFMSIPVSIMLGILK